MKVVEGFPLGQLSGEIVFVGECQQRVELSLIGLDGSLDPPVQPGSSWLDIGVPHSKIFDIPMELSLKIVPDGSTDEGPFPFVERVAGDAEVSARFRDVSRFRGMCEDFEIALNLVHDFWDAGSRPLENGESDSTCKAYL